MRVSYDLDAGATYVELSDAAIDRTMSVSDLVMVDVAEDGEPVGVDFAVAPAKITHAMIDGLVARFPVLRSLCDRDRWLLTSA